MRHTKKYKCIILNSNGNNRNKFFKLVLKDYLWGKVKDGQVFAFQVPCSMVLEKTFYHVCLSLNDFKK